MANNDKLKRKRVLNIQRSLQKEELEHKLDDLSGSDNEDIDFSKEIRPIGYYINDREKMIDEMFSVIKNEKLKKMLPPVLKKCSLEEVKADCLVHLLGMSKKRIYATLQGRDLNSSSDSETDSSNSVLGSDSSEEPQITSSTHVKSDVEEIDDTLDISISKNDLDSLIPDKRSQPNTSRKRGNKSKSDKSLKKIKTERSPSLIEISDDEIIIKKKKKDEKRPKKKPEKKSKPKHKHSKEKSKKAKSKSTDESDKETEDGSVLVDSKKGKSLLEILELEMRARAIRALLEANPNAVESSTMKQDPETSLDKSSEKVNTSTEDQTGDNLDESDSFDVEVINDNEDAIIILDDLDDQIILEPDNIPEPPVRKPSPKAASNKESSKNVPTSKNSSSEELPKNIPSDKEPSTHDPLKEESSKPDLVDEKPVLGDSTSNPDSSNTNLTWPERWAESKGVKEIVQNSKLCANIRKRMRFARMLKQKEQEEQQQQQQDQPENPLISELRRVEEGSVDQLQLLKLLDETKQKSDELTKKLNESGQDSANEPEPENAEDSSTSGKEEGEVDDDEPSTEQVPDSNEQTGSSKTIADTEIVDDSISCQIDLTDD